MADIADPSQLEQGSPADDPAGNGDTRGVKRQRPSTTAGDEDEDEDEKGSRDRRKIEIKFILDKSRRHITFSKRKAGIMKKAYELSVLTGTQVLLLVVSETGLVYTFTTPKLQPLVTKQEGKTLIQACLNAPEPTAEQNGVDTGEVAESTDEVPSLPPNHGAMPRGVAQAGYMPQQQVNDPYYGMSAQGGQYAGMPAMPQQQQRGAV